MLPSLRRSMFLAALIVALPIISFAQITISQSAHVNLYFPRLVDGGPPEQQWQTTFTFGNSDSGSTATVILVLLDPEGQLLTLDLGSGPNSVFVFTVPPLGSTILRSQIASKDQAVGWAVAASTLPLQGNVEFRTIVNGVPQLAITAEATIPSHRYFYPANFFTSFAFSNIYPDRSVSIAVTVRNAQGQQVGQVNETVPANGHRAFTLLGRFPGLGVNFEGTVDLACPSCSSVARYFVAWAMRSDGVGVISSLPPGRFKAPASHFDEIWLAFLAVLNVARAFSPEVFAEGEPIELQIGTESEINANGVST